MKKSMKKWIGILLAAALVLGTGIPADVLAASEGDSRVEITILETSDIHGMLTNYDYAADTSTKNGLAKAAAVIKEERAKDPDLLLADCGDILQGNLVSSFRTESISPAIKAMNMLGYDTWTLGNHEFDYEFSSLEHAIGMSDATVLGGNIYKQDGSRFASPYKIFTVKGVRVALFGITSPNVTRWVSDPAKYDNMTFTDPIEETSKILGELEGKADVIVGVVHIGENGDTELDGMNAIALKYGDKIDALLTGHSHANVAKSLVGNSFVSGSQDDNKLVMLEPGVNGENVGKCQLTVEKIEGKWTVTGRTAELIPTADKEPDPAMTELLKPYHEASLAEADKVIGAVGRDFYEDLYLLPGIPSGLIEDHALADLINRVQLINSGADVSMAALFSPDANLTKGEFKYKDGVKVYKFDNTLYSVNVTGAQLKKIMEVQAGALYNTWRKGDVTISFDPNFRLYKYDMFAGINYDINISNPAGQRIENATYQGRPLKDSQKLTLALNDYRWSSLTADGLIDKGAVVYNSKDNSSIPAVRDMIAEYVRHEKTIYPQCDNNWKITGADLEDPQKEMIYDMVRNGTLKVPATEDGRDQNIASLNAIDLRAAGTLPPLKEESQNPVKPPKTDSDTIRYVVKNGDTLLTIASRHNCTISDILALNKLSNANRLITGQKLLLPSIQIPEDAVIYTVVRGDSLSKIALKYNCSISALASYNHIPDVNVLSVGQKILIPAA